MARKKHCANQTCRRVLPALTFFDDDDEHHASIYTFNTRLIHVARAKFRSVYTQQALDVIYDDLFVC